MVRVNIGMQIGKKDMMAETPIRAKAQMSLLKEAKTPTMDDQNYIGRGNNTTTTPSIAMGAKRKRLHGSMVNTSPVPLLVKVATTLNMACTCH